MALLRRKEFDVNDDWVPLPDHSDKLNDLVAKLAFAREEMVSMRDYQKN